MVSGQAWERREDELIILSQVPSVDLENCVPTASTVLCSSHKLAHLLLSAWEVGVSDTISPCREEDGPDIEGVET